MRGTKPAAAENTRLERAGARLELVVPFTTPPLTLTALAAANRFGCGLQAGVRLLKIQVVPYPLGPGQTPVPVAFLKEQLRRMPSGLPTVCDVRLAREFAPGLKAALTTDSVVLIGILRRPWRTRNEWLAATLRRAGFTVLLVTEGVHNNA